MEAWKCLIHRNEISYHMTLDQVMHFIAGEMWKWAHDPGICWFFREQNVRKCHPETSVECPWKAQLGAGLDLIPGEGGVILLDRVYVPCH